MGVRRGLRQVRQGRGAAIRRFERAHRCGLRVGVGDSRNGLVVRRMRLAGDVRRDHVALVLADVGERPDPGDIANRPQAFARAHVLIDVDPVGSACTRRSRARSRRRAGADRSRRAADHPVARRRRRTRVRTRRPRAAPRWRACPSSSSMPSARSASLSARPSGSASRGSTRSAPSTIDRLSPNRRTTWAARRRRPAAQHEQPARNGLHARRPPRPPHPLEVDSPWTGGVDRLGRRSPRRCAPRCGGRRRPRPRPGPRAAGAAQQVDAVVSQPALLTGIGVVRNHEVAPRERRRDIDLGARPRLARAVHRLARAQQRLGGDACPVGALAADQLPLDHGDAKPAGGDRRRAVLPRGTASENDHVVVVASGRSVSVRGVSTVSRGDASVQ